MLKEISAGFIVYRKGEKEIEFLILYHRGGYWNFPKGKIESEERSFETAVRELKEETGIERNEIKIIPNFKTSEKFAFWKNTGNKNSRVFKIVIFYLAETKKEKISIENKHNGYAWFTFKDAMKILEKYKDSQRVLREVHNLLRREKLKTN